MKQRRHIFSIFTAMVFTLTLPHSIYAQLLGTRQIYDLNPGASGSYPTNLSAFATNVFFCANIPSTGSELWRSDGTGIFLVSNINNTVTDIGGGNFIGNNSTPQGMTAYSNMLYFSAYDPYRGAELWRTDGTNAARVADICPDADDSLKTNPNSSFPSGFTVFSNELFFMANSGTTKPNYELWKYNGTSVTQVANIHPDSGSDFSSYPGHLTPFKGMLYFMADDGSNGYELWRSTGTNATLFTNINPGNASSSSFPQYFTPFNDHLYFQAFTSNAGYELWQTDGTNASRVTDLNPNSASSFPTYLTVFNNALYFQATDSTNGFELWRYDGAILSLVSNLNQAGDSFPKDLIVFQNALYFSANDGVHGWELWKYDGTNASLVTDLNLSGDSFPESLTVFSNTLYFSATTPDTGYELWRYDGTNVLLTADLNPGPASSYPQYLTVAGNALFFSAADDGISNWELWKVWSAPFQITAIQNLGPDISLNWATLGGTTNIVQAADTILGPFTNLSDSIIIQGIGETVTNYTDVGATETNATRFYRIIQQ